MNQKTYFNPMFKDGKTPVTSDLYESPNKERNEKKYGNLCENQCICCYAPMKKGEVLHVHMNTDWKAVHIDINESDFEKLTGCESQGCFPIGNACAKKMPKGFTFRQDFTKRS